MADEAWSSTPHEAGVDRDWKTTLPAALAEETWPTSWTSMIERLSATGRISREDAVMLANDPNLNHLGRLATMLKEVRYGRNVFFNANVHVNHTNICVLACRFCAFRRGPRAEDAYALDVDAYVDAVGEYADLVDEVHTVGGLHPSWSIEHYETMFRRVRAAFPHVHVKALTAVEVKHLAQMSGLSIHSTLERLRDAGLGSLPGGGAEILDDGIRAVICNGKESSLEYLSIHETAHQLGIPTNATMLFGTIEGHEHRIDHMLKLREVQDRTGGFQCFVPYPFLPDSTRLPEAQLATGPEVLRVIALARIVLDNIPHIKAYRMNIGEELTELALNHGADDVDGTVSQESIMHLAGATSSLDHSTDELARLIEASGGIPVRRNTTYTSFQHHVFAPVTPNRRLPIARG